MYDQLMTFSTMDNAELGSEYETYGRVLAGDANPLRIKLYGISTSRLVSLAFDMKRVGLITDVCPVDIKIYVGSTLIKTKSVELSDLSANEYTRKTLFVNTEMPDNFYTNTGSTEIRVEFCVPDAKFALGGSTGYDIKFLSQVWDSGKTAYQVFTGGKYNYQTNAYVDLQTTTVAVTINCIYKKPDVAMAVYEGVHAYDIPYNPPLADLLSAGYVRRRARVALYEPKFPVASPPYTETTGFVQLNHLTDIDYDSYKIEHTLDLAASSLSMEVGALPAVKYIELMLPGRVLVVTEEYSVHGKAPITLNRGTFFIATVEPSIKPESKGIAVTADGPLSRLNAPFSGKLWADRIAMGKRLLTMVKNPKDDNTDYYLFVDGDAQTHTINWCEKPAPVLHLGTPTQYGKRIDKKGPIDIYYGTGEVFIAKDYFESKTDEGGLGNPANISLDYARWAEPSDEIESNVTLVEGNHIWISSAGRSYWPGCTIEITSGNAKHKTYTISAHTEVNTGCQLTLGRNDDPETDGVVLGDSVIIVNSNRAGRFVPRLLYSVGFQDSHSNYPLYIKSIVEPSPTFPIPSTTEFNASYSDNMTAQELMEKALKYVVPNHKLIDQPDGSVVFIPITQSETPDTNVAYVESASKKHSDANVYNRVRYKVRNRDIQDSLRWLSPDIKSHTACTEGTIGFRHGEDIVDKKVTEQNIVRTVTDHNAETGVIWTADVDLVSDWENKVLVEFKYNKIVRFKEMHLRGHSQHKKELLVIEARRDGVWIPLTDEISFTGEILFTVSAGDSFRDTDEFDGVRVVCGTPHVSRSLPDHAKYSSLPKYTVNCAITSFAVYLDDVVVGESENTGLQSVMGDKLYETPDVDEYGFYIARTLGIDLDEYARRKARDLLFELSNEFAPVSTGMVQPDVNLGDTVQISIDPLGSHDTSMLVKSVTVEHSGKVTADLVAYGVEKWGGTNSTTTSTSSTSSSTSSTLPPGTTPPTFTQTLTLTETVTSTTTSTRTWTQTGTQTKSYTTSTTASTTTSTSTTSTTSTITTTTTTTTTSTTTTTTQTGWPGGWCMYASTVLLYNNLSIVCGLGVGGARSSKIPHTSYYMCSIHGCPCNRNACATYVTSGSPCNDCYG